MGNCCSQESRQFRNPRHLVAIHSYEAKFDSDLTFRKGDEMKVLDDRGSEWWKVYHVGTGKSGMIPRKYVAEKGSLDAEDCFFKNCSRQQAECLLLDDKIPVPVGSFLVRVSETNPNSHSLSLKDYSENGKSFRIKHYKINHDKSGYFIDENTKEPTIMKLVKECRDRHLMCQYPMIPCPKDLPTLYVLSPKLRELEIDRHEVRKQRLLNQGHFGEVHLGTWSRNLVAIKSMKQGQMSKRAFLKEAEIMREFRHEKLVAIYAVCTKTNPIWIIQEFMCNGSLLDYLRRSKVYFSSNDLIYFSTQIAQGMKFLESKRLVHSDLAARNVLVGRNKVVKISDFGLARILNGESNDSQGMKLAVRWTAPEVFNRRIVHSTKSDVWSYGVVLYEIFSYGETPYGSMKDQDILKHLNLGWRLPKPKKDTFPDDIYTGVVLQCWKKNPDERPTFVHLHNHFENYAISTERQYNSLNRHGRTKQYS